MRKILLLLSFFAVLGLVALPAWAGAVSPYITGPGGGSPSAGGANTPALSGSVIYNNDFGGVVSGDNFNMDGFTINFGYIVGNSFQLASGTNLTGIEFAGWAFPGDSLTSVDWAIRANDGADPLSGTVLASGTANPTESFIETNGNGYSILDESFGIPSLGLAGGTTYWLVLQNASVPSGDPFYWDQSDGPSVGYDSAIGYLTGFQPCGGLCTGSESFKLYGGGPSIPEPTSLILFGSGLLLLGGLLRRRLS